MKSLQWFILCAAVLGAVAMCDRALAVPTLDGSADPNDGYGAALSTQHTDTQFGNATFDDLIASGGGSEIDQVFGKIENGRLYMVFAGNLENNFNKLQIFVDSVAGGVNKIDGDIFTPLDNNVPFGLDPFCCGGFVPPAGGNTDNIGALQRMDGMTFDASFSADYAMIFTHGGESVGDPNSSLGFWAMSAHYADLTQGTAGAVVAAGIQLAPTGLPNVLRGPLGADFNEDGDVSGDDFLIWQRNNGLFDPNAPTATKADGDANGDGLVNAADLALWESEYGTDPGFSDFPFNPINGSGPSTEVLIGPALPGLSQGELIDRSYALAAGGCTDDSGAGCVVAELEFVLDVVDPNSGNPNNHRNFENTVGMELGFNNSNTVGVDGCGDPNACAIATTGDPGSVITGVEFSIALSEIGDPNSLSEIKIAAFVNGGGHDFSSNQYAGTGVLQNNLGGDGMGGFTGDFSGVDLSAITGDQFVTLTVPALSAVAAVPEPTAVVLLGIGAACGLLNRKRRC